MQLPRLSLTTQIFATSASIVILVLAIALALTQRAAQSAAQISLAKGLEAAEQSVTDLLVRESSVLASKVRAYADNPVYRASIEAKDAEYLDYTQTAAEQTGARWVQLVSRDGVRLGIVAPASVPVHRQEVYSQIRSANQAAANPIADLAALGRRLLQQP